MAVGLRKEKRKRERETETESRVAEAIVESQAEGKCAKKGIRIIEEGKDVGNTSREQASKAVSRLSDVQIDGQGSRNERKGGIGMEQARREI